MNPTYAAFSTQGFPVSHPRASSRKEHLDMENMTIDDVAYRDVESAGMGKLVKLTHGPCLEWRPARRPAMVVTNPPWGTRLLGQTHQHGSSPRCPDALATYACARNLFTWQYHRTKQRGW